MLAGHPFKNDSGEMYSPSCVDLKRSLEAGQPPRALDDRNFLVSFAQRMERSQATHPNVFISYSHDSSEHEDKVLSLANQLRADGIEALIDQYESAPPDGWTRWMRNAIKQANLVLVICTETYQQRAEANEETGKGRGVNREGLMIYKTI